MFKVTPQFEEVEWAFICKNGKKEQLVVVEARGDKESCLTVMETFSRGPVHGIHVGLRQDIAWEKWSNYLDNSASVTVIIVNSIVHSKFKCQFNCQCY